MITTSFFSDVMMPAFTLIFALIVIVVQMLIGLEHLNVYADFPYENAGKMFAYFRDKI